MTSRNYRRSRDDASEDGLLFPHRDGRPWADHDYRNWRKRAFAPAAKGVGLNAARPYALRHAFCSLLLAEGRSVVEVAAQ